MPDNSPRFMFLGHRVFRAAIIGPFLLIPSSKVGPSWAAHRGRFLAREGVFELALLLGKGLIGNGKWEAV